MKTKNLFEECRWRNKKTLGIHTIIMAALIITTIALFIYATGSIAIRYLSVLAILGMITGYGEMIISKGKNDWLLIASVVIFLVISVSVLGWFISTASAFAGIIISEFIIKVEESICKKASLYNTT